MIGRASVSSRIEASQRQETCVAPRRGRAWRAHHRAHTRVLPSWHGAWPEGQRVVTRIPSPTPAGLPSLPQATWRLPFHCLATYTTHTSPCEHHTHAHTSAKGNLSKGKGASRRHKHDAQHNICRHEWKECLRGLSRCLPLG